MATPRLSPEELERRKQAREAKWAAAKAAKEAEAASKIDDNLNDFVGKYLPSKYPNNWHHELFYGILDNTLIQDQKTGLMHTNKGDKKNNSVLIFAPRGHAKSTCVTINYPVWELYKNPATRILIVSANQEIATGFVRAIMWQLENNNTLKDKFKDLVPSTKRKWGERAFTVERDSKEKDPSVAGLGVGGKLISRRADIIIIDDLLDIDTARTPASRKKTREWFENVLLPILEEGGRLVIVGTAWYKGDLLDVLYKEGNFDVKLKLKALLYNSSVHLAKGHERALPYNLAAYPQALDVSTIMDDGLKTRWSIKEATADGVLWKDVWSFEKLMNKKETQNMSDAAFSRQYLNEPMAETDKLFKERHLQIAVAKGNNKSLLSEYDNSNLPSGSSSYGNVLAATGLDLAISRNRTSDDSAIATWGLTEDRMYVPLWLDAGKWSPAETKQKVLDNFNNYKPIKIKVESVAYQDMMRQELQEDDMPIEGFATTSSKKFNEETGIARVATLMEQGRIILPAAKTSPERFAMVQRLQQEMLDYTYDSHAGDLLMASWFAIHALLEFDKKMMDNRGFFNNSALVDQMKQVIAPHKIMILSTKPQYFRFMYNSLVYVYGPVEEGKLWFTEKDKFYIFVTKEDRGVAYIFNKLTSEVVGKIEGKISALMFASLLEKAGQFFNNAQIVVNKSDEGKAIMMELSTRNYPHLLAMQPDEMGFATLKDGFVITEQTLPIALDNFRLKVNDRSVLVRDNQLVSEMAEIIDVRGASISAAHGEAQRVKTLSVGLWLLQNYEKEPEKLYNQDKAGKKVKKLNVPYRVFKR